MFLEKVNSPTDLKALSLTELKAYSQEVRDFVIDCCQKNGGHLASNLGAVELTIALHYAFDSPTDKLVWDVGHQAYTHKLITGRRQDFECLRQNGGVSGFPSVLESEHDHFTSGHSSNSLSLALGLRRAADLKGEDCKVLPIIGDGAFSGGMVFEALNDIGEKKEKVIIVLNDNKMSISKNVGAMSKYLAKLRLSLKYNSIKRDIKKGMSVLPLGGAAIKSLESLKERAKSFFVAGRFFESLGIMYYGPFDGHNIAEMVEVFKKAALKDKPVLVHLITQKGRGFADAETRPDKFHGVSAALCETAGDPILNQAAPPEPEFPYSKILGETLIEAAERDERVVAVTAAMAQGTGLEEFSKRFPTRYFDVSIAEQHAVSLCAGLARGGMRPFFAVYSTFLQRGFDQLLHETGINKLPVTFAIDRAGANGSDGVTHQGIFDLSYLTIVPNLVVLAPKDGAELAAMLDWSLGYDGAVAIRYPKGYCRNYGSCAPIELGKWEKIKDGKTGIYLLAVGCRMNRLACDFGKLRPEINVVNARFIKPLDTAFLDSINKKGNLIVTLEDNIRRGGFGESVLSYYNSKGVCGAEVRILAHPNEYSDNRNTDSLLLASGLSIEGLAALCSDLHLQKI